MSRSTRRGLIQTVPLALLILGIGLARQDATGAPLVGTGSKLLAKAHSIFIELSDTFEAPAATSPVAPSAPAAPAQVESPPSAFGAFPASRAQVPSFCSRRCQH